MSDLRIWTIGHSTHSYAHFHTLLREADVTAIADVRSSPFSRHFPQFNRDTLKHDLKRDGVAYSFLGKELGGRPADKVLFCDGIADYERMALTEEFQRGLDRVIEGSKSYRIALMCSEHDPLDCHRCLLVSRALKARGLTVNHILPNGTYKSQSAIEEELLSEAGFDQTQTDFFAAPEDRLATAYRNRARKVAFSLPDTNRLKTVAAE
jgi:uncharacterized protein (DUF488 family)